MIPSNTKIGLKLERMAYELSTLGGTVKANGNPAAQRELDAIITLMAALGERLNPTQA